MKLFYNEDGVVVGSIEGATPEIEAGIKIPGTQEIQVPQELAERLESPTDSLHPHILRVENDEIIVPEPNTPDTPAS